MPRTPVDDFARACRASDGETLTDLVAALYEARGATVERRGTQAFTFTAADGTTRHVAVEGSGGESSMGPDVDTVVSVAQEPSVPTNGRLVDTADLHEQLCYAIDVETGDRLLAEYLGLSPADTNSVDDSTDSTTVDERHDSDGTSNREDSATNEETSSETTPTTSGSNRKRAVLALSAGLLCLSVLLLGGLALVGGEQPTVNSPASNDTTPTPTATPVQGEELMNQTTLSLDSPGTDWVPGRQWPPGVNRTAVNASQLLAAHTGALDSTSYTVTLTYWEYRDGYVRNGYAETVKVSNDSRAEATTSTFGSLQTKPWQLLGESRASSGRYVQRSEADSPGAIVQRNATRYLGRLLSATEARLVDHNVSAGVTTTQIRLTGSPDPTVGNATGSVYATQTGLVRFARWQFEPDDAAGHVVVTLHVTAVGETTVTESPLGVDLS